MREERRMVPPLLKLPLEKTRAPAIEHDSTSDEVNAQFSTNKLSILIVEDDPIVASYIEEVLTEAEFHVAGVAASASEALSLLDHDKPDLALIDIRLTGQLDGIDLACLIRTKINAPTIFLSGSADAPTRLRAEAARPLAFLQKPFRPSKLFNAIQRALT
jgi:two-component system, response regulator PdtaR